MVKKSLGLSLVLLLAVTTVGCLQQGEFALVDSNLADTNQNKLASEVSEITFSFNQPVANAEISLVENGKHQGLTVKKAGTQLKVTDLDLQPASDYQLRLQVQGEAGQVLTDEFKFKTKPNHPSIENHNRTLLQTFYWEMNKGEYAKKYPAEKNLWNLLAKRADDLAAQGISEVWIPPANKAHERKDEGYGIYDPWDLGEFKQNGTVRTKYGTRKQLEDAISTLHQQDIKVYYDAVLNHRIAAGSKNLEQAPLASGQELTTYTDFSNLKGRQKYYSQADQWSWDWQAFDGVDYSQEEGSMGPRRFKDKSWDDTYDKDYLLASDIDYENKKVRHEMIKWGQWLINDIGFDGFRIDAIKHISSDFVDQWLTSIQQNTDQDVFFVGEAWIENQMGLNFYLNDVGNDNLNIFDFPLRNTFKKLRDGSLNLAALKNAGLVNSSQSAQRAVTFVDNHDTGRDKIEYQGPINKRKMQAYTYILMREEGTPMVYWKDYYINGYKDELDKLLEVRKYYAYGSGREVDNNDTNVYSYVREGLEDKPGTGLVMMITGGDSGEQITKKIATGRPNTTFYDYTGNVAAKVTTNQNGVGKFQVKNSPQTGWSVWVPVE